MDVLRPPRNEIMKVYLNGQLVEKEKAVVSVFDHGLLYGDGVFEGIRAYDGRVFKLERHIERLFDSAKALRITIPASREGLQQLVLDAGEVNGLVDESIRVVVRKSVDLGGRRII